MDRQFKARLETRFGDVLTGPALVVGPDSTCLVLPGQRGSVDAIGTLVLTEA